MNDELRTTIKNALIFSRDTLAESAAALITDGALVIAPEIARHNAALAWLHEQQQSADTPTLDWDKASAHLDFFAKAYEDLGDTGRFGLAITIMPLQARLARGERTQWLYDDIMEVS